MAATVNQDTILLSGATLLGACIGSYLNVVIYRLPLDPAVSLGSRSVCPGCRAPIPWFLNLPIVSWLLLRGKARCCGARIGVRYPLVEAVTALFFALLVLYPPAGVAPSLAHFVWQPWVAFGLFGYFAANLIANTFIDIDHRILPDALTIPGMVIGVLGSLLVPGLAGAFPLAMAPAANSFMFSLVGLAVGAGVTWAVRWVGTVAFRKEAMGLGDVKFMGMIGAFVGWDGALLTLLLGSVLGAVGGTLHQLRSGDSVICFGPFLAGGAVLSLFLRKELIEFFVVTLPNLQQSRPWLSWLMLGFAASSLVVLFFLIRRGRRA